MIDWSWNWFTQKRPIWQSFYGSCEPCSSCYAVAMRAYIQGYPLLEFSQLYLYGYGQGGWGSNIPNLQTGRGMGSMLSFFQTRGCCLESLHPAPPWEGVDTTKGEFGIACWAALRTPPSAAAEADATQHMVVDWAYFATLYDGSMADMAAKGIAALDAGYTLTAFKPPNHEICIWGYYGDLKSGGWIGPDSHSQNAESGGHSFGSLYIDAVVRDVVYKNMTRGPRPSPMPKPGTPPVVILPPPPPKGNTQMLIDGIKLKAGALTLGAITKAQIDALKADVNQLVPDAGAVTPPAAGLLHDIGPGESFVSTAGDTWSIAAPNVFKRNGVGASGLYGTRMVEDATGAVKARRDLGDGAVSWQLAIGGGWKSTSAP